MKGKSKDLIEFEKYVGTQCLSKKVVSKKQYKRLSDPNIRLYGSKNKELQKKIDELLALFD